MQGEKPLFSLDHQQVEGRVRLSQFLWFCLEALLLVGAETGCVPVHLRGAGCGSMDVNELCIRCLLLEPAVQYTELLPEVFSASAVISVHCAL